MKILVFIVIVFTFNTYGSCSSGGVEYLVEQKKGSMICGEDGYWKATPSTVKTTTKLNCYNPTSAEKSLEISISNEDKIESIISFGKYNNAINKEVSTKMNRVEDANSYVTFQTGVLDWQYMELHNPILIRNKFGKFVSAYQVVELEEPRTISFETNVIYICN